MVREYANALLSRGGYSFAAAVRQVPSWRRPWSTSRERQSTCTAWLWAISMNDGMWHTARCVGLALLLPKRACHIKCLRRVPLRNMCKSQGSFQIDALSCCRGSFGCSMTPGMQHNIAPSINLMAVNSNCVEIKSWSSSAFVNCITPKFQKAGLLCGLA